MMPKMSKNCRKPRARNPVEMGTPSGVPFAVTILDKNHSIYFVLSIKHSLGLPSSYHQIVKVSPNICVCIYQ